jgi:hypothetical protein
MRQVLIDTGEVQGTQGNCRHLPQLLLRERMGVAPLNMHDGCPTKLHGLNGDNRRHFYVRGAYACVVARSR